MGKTIRKNIILASASPRRKELLARVIDDFSIVLPQADETLPQDMHPIDAAMYLAHKKAKNVASENQGIIIGADTVVVLKNRILGKPRDLSHAKEMLLELSQSTHNVITGICIFDTYSGKMSCNYCLTEVTFDIITSEEADNYLSLNESMDKAGAYAIQGKASKYVKRINGCYYNVVGLPINMLCNMLSGFDLGG